MEINDQQQNKITYSIILFCCCNLLIVCARSISKMLPSAKFAEDKVLVFVILCEKKFKNSETLTLTLIPIAD